MICPICGEEGVDAFHPFCSKRCADVDLGRWMTGRYAIPAEAPEELEQAAEELSHPPQRPH